MKPPSECCGLGSYRCCVPVAVKNKIEWVDFCIADIVVAMNAAGLETVASCCGHGRIDGVISLRDGRELRVEKAAEKGEEEVK